MIGSLYLQSRLDKWFQQAIANVLSSPNSDSPIPRSSNVREEQVLASLRERKSEVEEQINSLTDEIQVRVMP